MGFWAKRYSTLLKGTRATAWKERIEARRAIRQLRTGDEFYKRAMRLIEVHKVTAALRKLRAAIKSLAASAENADAFIFNVLTQDKSQVEAELDILKALMELSQVTPRNNATLIRLERDLALAVLTGTKNYQYADKGERAEYRQVESILKEATADKDGFMARLRLIFQKQDTVSLLARFPMRRGASRQKRDILMLKSIARRIRSLKPRFKANREKEVERELIEDTQKIVADLKDAFYQSYSIKKRDTIIVLKILFDLHSLRSLIFDSMSKHYLPEQPGTDLLDEIAKIEEHIVKDFHPIAQGFRIVIAEMENVEKEAEIDVGRITARAA